MCFVTTEKDSTNMTKYKRSKITNLELESKSRNSDHALTLRRSKVKIERTYGVAYRIFNQDDLLIAGFRTKGLCLEEVKHWLNDEE